MKAMQFIGAALLLAGSLLMPGIAGADTLILVETNADNLVTDGLCTLREAIINANSNLSTYADCSAGSGTDTINFSGSYTITLGSQLPIISSPIIITGQGAANTIIQASTCNPITLPGGCTPAAYRVLQVADTGNLTLDALTVRHGSAPTYGGGILAYAGVLTMTNTVLTGNRSVDGGGGIYGAGSMHLTGSTVSGNNTGGGGGGVMVNAGGSLWVENGSISSNDGFTGGGIYNNGSATVIDTIIANNHAYGAGGGILNGPGRTLSSVGSLISGNNASGEGGGIMSDGSVMLVTSTVTGNSSSEYGGGIYSADSLTVSRSTISLNESSMSGGGIYTFPATALEVYNSTISGNTAMSGGGITAAGTSTLLNTTISGNIALAAGGIYNGVGATLNYSNTIIANSDAPEECFNNGAIGTHAGNLVEDGTCLAELSGDPALGLLGDHGGLTQTHVPLPGSPAIDAGNAAACANLSISGVDQRERPRNFDGDHDGTAGCDIGAHESHNLVLVSAGDQDGWLLESGESSSRGGTLSSAAAHFRLGDEAANQQYRAILSFTTSGLPAEAVVVGAVLRIKKQGLPVGTDPFTTHGRLKIDIDKPYFGAAASLALDDFNAAAGRSSAGVFKRRPRAGWFSAVLSPAAYSYINRNGRTQFRLRFVLDDNDDLDADYYKFFSGDALTAGTRPRLWLEYYVP